jgi:hypothetical protein
VTVTNNTNNADSEAQARPEWSENTTDEAVATKRESVAPPATLVRWEAVVEVAVALAKSARRDDELTRQWLNAALRQLLRPHLLLSELHRLAVATIAGGMSTRGRLAQRLAELAHNLPDLVTAGRHFLAASTRPKTHSNPSHDLPTTTSLDFDSIMVLLAAAHRACGRDQSMNVSPPIAALFGLLAATEPLERLSALRRQGTRALLEQWRWSLGTGAPFLEVRGGAGPIRPTSPGDLAPELEGDTPSLPKGDLPRIVQELIEAMRDRPLQWDPQDWAPRVAFPQQWIMPVRHMGCLELAAGMQRLMGQEPPRPSRVVWADNITSVSIVGPPCAGSTLVIKGSGFGNPRPANVGLMLGIEGVCTPVEFVPGTWSDTRIEMELPVGITSATVGFVDLAYAVAYNTWAKTVNETIEKVRPLCASVAPPSFIEPINECATATPVNQLLGVGQAYIKSFTVNGASTPAIVPGDELAFEWTVSNAIALTLERVGAAGPLLNGSAAVALPLAETQFTVIAGHTAPTFAHYRLRARGTCGADATADVFVVLTQRPGLSVESLEVTQGIQTVPRTLRLVENKTTVVRVTVRHALNTWGPNQVTNVVGRLHVHVYGTGQQAWLDACNVPPGAAPGPMTPTPGASITVVASPLRVNTNDTLNFRVPAALCRGEVKFKAQIRVIGFDAQLLFPGWTEEVKGAITVTFEHRRQIVFRYVPVTWNGVTPTNAVCSRTVRAAEPYLPVPSSLVSPLPGEPPYQLAPYVAKPTGGGWPTGGSRNSIDLMLWEFWYRHNCNLRDPVLPESGAACPKDDGSIWVLVAGTPVTVPGSTVARYSALLIGSNVCFVPPLDGETAAHELGHCFMQRHIASPCLLAPGVPPPTGVEPTSSWPGTSAVTDVPFNWLTNSTITAGMVGVWDLMTYCQTTWTSPVRWQRLWDEVGG